RPIRRRDAGAHPVACVHADREGGPHPLSVLRRHQRKLEPIEVLPEHRHADDAAGMPDCEGQQCGRGLAGREDDVTLILPVGVVAHYHGPACGDIGDCALNGVQDDPVHLERDVLVGCVLPAIRATRSARSARSGRSWLRVRHGRAPPGSRRSTYLAITSTSMLTLSPTAALPRVVLASVSGIRLTSNQLAASSSGLTADTVRLTPSTATEPFS